MDPSVPPLNGLCPFNELPNEMRDRIFHFAYVEDGPFRPINRSDWEKRENYGHQDEYEGLDWDFNEVKKTKFVPRDFGASHVERFMVSRLWFVQALTYFYKTTTFDFSHRHQLHSFVNYDALAYALPATSRGKRLRKVPLNNVLVSISAKATRWPEGHDRFVISGCQPTLRKVCLRFDGGYFSRFREGGKDIRKEEWTNADFEEHGPIKELLKLRELPNIVLESEPHYWGPDDHNAMLQRNVKSLQALLRTAAARPYDPEPARRVLRSQSKKDKSLLLTG